MTYTTPETAKACPRCEGEKIEMFGMTEDEIGQGRPDPCVACGWLFGWGKRPIRTPALLAAAIAPMFAGTVETLDVTEGLHGWRITARIQPDDKRRRPSDISESGTARAHAVEVFLAEAWAWAQVTKMKTSVEQPTIPGEK